MPKDNESIRNIADTSFQLFFKTEKSHFIDLYEVLSGRRLKEDDVEPYFLKSDVITKPLNNDVSYLTKDNRLIILVEHQSTPSPNMPQREFLYYAALSHEWLTDNNRKLSSNVETRLPMPEFYVAYNGKKPFDQSTLSMKNDFISVNCKLVDINLENIIQSGKPIDKNNALTAYSCFMHEYRAKFGELTAAGVDTGQVSKTAFEHARQKCINEGFRPDIFERKDFMLTLGTLLSREEELRLEGLEEGIEKGRVIYLQQGIEQGIEQGRKEAAYNFAKKTNLQTTPKQLADIFEITPEAAEAAYAQAKLDLDKDPLQKLENAKLNISIPKL